ncbi:MAG: DUF6125 family protein [Methermicoccaceae archaeon]
MKITLSDEQKAEYLHRCYTAADGLWFMKVEEKYGFATALDIDNEVWKVLPKIQARTLKSMLNVGNGMDALLACFTTKLTLEGFEFEAEKCTDGLKVVISRCPWHGLMVKSGREKLSEQVGNRICNTEYALWASEFDENMSFELSSQICKGDERCVLQFRG